MQSKGAIKFVAILLALASLYVLSFTAVSGIQEKKAVKYAEAAVAAAQQSPAFSSVSVSDQAYYLDSLRKEKNRFYLDSIATEKVYFGLTYKKVKEQEINLGLDLKGGMNVMLQVELRSLVEALADHNPSPEFSKALDLASSRENQSRSDYITLFEEAWNEVAPNQRLSQIFGTYSMREKIKPESTNAEVMSVIRGEAESAVANSFNVLRNRIDRFGVASPNIQRIGNTGRILVELPGVKEPERVRKLLQGTASLEFWTTYENSEVFPYLNEANAIIRDLNSMIAEAEGSGAQEDSTEAAEEAAAPADSTSALIAEESAEADLSAQEEAYSKNNPLFYVLNPSMYNGQMMPGPCVGIAHYKDTAKVNAYLAIPQVKAVLPADLRLYWGVKPSEQIKDGSYFELIAIKVSTNDGTAPLDGGCITDARTSYNNTSASPEVDMAMDAEGARVWARLTSDNIGKCIAIVLDGMVYSYPRVNTEISGGRSQITGNFTPEEADDLSNVLKSGKLPAPANIVQEQVVGPSLGSESINAGMISFIIAFCLVLVYMLLFYQGAGVAADVALLCNVLFLLGALVSFHAVLTLPGIAGLVLTLGMAVDSNVIIYERIKEELRAGKALRLAIQDGYRNAYSAIIDGNITTILTGIILFFFGSGPVQGFATTLVIGIITSLATSIFITRLIFEARLSKGKNVKFYTHFTKNWMQNTHIDFINSRKVAYIVSGILILASLTSIFTKGFTYGVDFTGGRTYVVRFDTNVTDEQIREAVLAEFNGSAEVKQFGGDSQMKITTTYKIDENSSEVDAEVDGMLYNALKGFFNTPLSFDEFTSTLDNPNGIISSDKVGPTIANDIKRDAVIAVILALIVIFGYVAMRFKGAAWGAGGVTALMHDAIIVIGFFSIFSGILPFTLDVDQTFIAAVLTIIGYSINDTVVIFDRMREYKMLYPKREFKQTINDALNSTLARTVNTSGTTIVVMLAIAIAGGAVIRGMAVALCVGVIIGTYSSLFISAPIMYDITMKKEKKAAK